MVQTRRSSKTQTLCHPLRRGSGCLIRPLDNDFATQLDGYEIEEDSSQISTTHDIELQKRRESLYSCVSACSTFVTVEDDESFLEQTLANSQIDYEEEIIGTLEDDDDDDDSTSSFDLVLLKRGKSLGTVSCLSCSSTVYSETEDDDDEDECFYEEEVVEDDCESLIDGDDFEEVFIMTWPLKGNESLGSLDEYLVSCNASV